MVTKTGIVWDTPILFTNLVEDCGHTAELITPHLLAAPFFRRSLHALIIPSGFGNSSYSSVLPALRATSDRIERFVEKGGTLLVFGAGSSGKNAYDWLPVDITYTFGFREERTTEWEQEHMLTSITEDCKDPFTIDGTIESDEGEPILRCEGRIILIRIAVGAGEVILTTLHEYPSRRFLTGFCAGKDETLF